jgi:ligand-binding sensor domain-containing protein
MKYGLIYILFLLFVSHTACGQKPTEPHQDNINYNIKDTVTSYGPNTMVRHVRQDRNGNILFAASWGGVFRYDGKSFTNIASKIGSRRYWNVLEDRHGNLWFASTDSGVYHYNGKTFKHFTTKEGLVNNVVFSIYEDRAGNIWFGTGGGVSRYDGKSFQNFTNNGGNSIMEDKTGKLWFATGDGPCVYDGKTFTILKNKDGSSFKNVWSIMEDKKGSIWFGDADGFWRYDGSTFTKVSERGAYAIIQDKKGNIWTTGDVNPSVGQGWALSRYDAKSLYNKVPTVKEIISGETMDFLGILEANDGSLWFGSGGGVHRYDGKTLTDFRTKENQQLRPHHQLK